MDFLRSLNIGHWFAFYSAGLMMTINIAFSTKYPWVILSLYTLLFIVLIYFFTGFKFK